ncbi:MAG: SMP-30/gluconolactonase/LRE family protein [Candidatus Latescibacteria bacterium]|nr:SMP-30/gluconolactonase/LRE family protein [Candidatus Latescibacterota bacterium]
MGCATFPFLSKQQPVISEDAQIIKISDGYTWAEGPVEDRDGNLYFTDNRENLIHRLKPGGTVSVFMRPAYRANGLYLDRDGSIIACTGDPKQVASIDKNGDMTVLADSFEGEPLNAPNDLWIDKKGGIYFTDPYWGKEKERDRVLYLTPDRKKVILATKNMVKPNGVIGTPDGKRLYVSDWNEKKTYVFSIDNDGILSDKKLFAPEGDDGMTMDVKGNVYLSGDDVTVYNPKGEKIATIRVPETAANMCFGGKDKKTLFITARTSVYLIKMQVQGMY